MLLREFKLLLLPPPSRFSTSRIVRSLYDPLASASSQARSIADASCLCARARRPSSTRGPSTPRAWTIACDQSRVRVPIRATCFKVASSPRSTADFFSRGMAPGHEQNFPAVVSAYVYSGCHRSSLILRSRESHRTQTSRPTYSGGAV